MQNVIVKTPTIILLFYNSHIAEMRLKIARSNKSDYLCIMEEKFQNFTPPLFFHSFLFKK